MAGTTYEGVSVAALTRERFGDPSGEARDSLQGEPWLMHTSIEAEAGCDLTVSGPYTEDFKPWRVRQDKHVLHSAEFHGEAVAWALGFWAGVQR